MSARIGNSKRPIDQNNNCRTNKRRKTAHCCTIELESWLTSRSTITLAQFRKLGISNGYKYVPQWNQIQPPYLKEFFIGGKNLLLTVITDKSLHGGSNRECSSSESSSSVSSSSESSSSKSSNSEFAIDEISTSDFSIGKLSSDESGSDSSSYESSSDFDLDQTTS
ncbi:hypothetical protein ACLKA7_012091 [Drosophila subpalustris]